MKILSLAGPLAMLLCACDSISFGLGPDANATDPEPEVVDESVVAGANQNDRSEPLQGEDLRTGAMVVSDDGRFIVMQRNVRTVLYDATGASYHELPVVLRRIAFNHASTHVFGVGADGALHAIDLAARATVWSTPLPAGSSASLLRVSDDDSAIVLGQSSALHVIDAALGSVRSSTPTRSEVRYAAFVPGAQRALAVGKTEWKDGGPLTPIYTLDLRGSEPGHVGVEIPNCEAPIEISQRTVNGDAARAFLSPTYCSPGAAAVPGETWTNPDPVSVIDVAGDSLTFVKNLPGFGPVAMAKDGARLVAYLDTARMDPAMFDDPKQVPWTEGDRYHLMTIDPVSLRFALAPIGDAIPRFALTRDGRGVLVDASVKASSRTKIAARASVSVSADGIEADAEAKISIFGSASAFGYFDLDTQKFSAFSGGKAPLDRFVQFADNRHVLTLEARDEWGGGPGPVMIDLSTRRVVQVVGDYGRGVRDLGLSADGSLALIRVRLPAGIHDGGYYGREGLCVSNDGSCSLSLTATYEESAPFALIPPPPPDVPAPDPRTTCTDRHEC